MLYTQREKTGDIITFKNFKEGGLVSVNDNGMEIGEDPDDDSTLPPLIIGDEINERHTCNEYDSKPMPADMLEEICDRSQYHPSINIREAR